jgi:hypothetical protein
MAPELALGGLQRWMQSVIVHPGSVDDAVGSPAAGALVPPDRVGETILPSASLTPVERIGIYHGMYALRMAEALESDYPALAHFLGEARWSAVVRGYVEAHPSRSYTLNALGRSLPEWLRVAPELPRRGFCRDLARLEWAVVEAFDAEETPRLAEAELARVPPEGWETARLVPTAALRLVDVHWNVNEWLDSTKDDRHEHPKPRRRDAWVVVFRQSYAVYRRELSRPAFHLLSDLAAGRPVGEALAAALRRRAAPDPQTLNRWFRDWAADGLFTWIAPSGHRADRRSRADTEDEGTSGRVMRASREGSIAGR